MSLLIDFIRIPEERIRILKKKKNFKEMIEKLSETKIEFNDEVFIESDESLKILRAKLVIQAFGRGFDLESSLNLLDEDFYLETINIKDFSGKSESRMKVLKGRVIGTKGKIKRLIEETTNTKIAVYGKTVSIIGRWNDLMKAKNAIEMILSGSLHSTVYKFLTKR